MWRDRLKATWGSWQNKLHIVLPRAEHSSKDTKKVRVSGCCHRMVFVAKNKAHRGGDGDHPRGEFTFLLCPTLRICTCHFLSGMGMAFLLSPYAPNPISSRSAAHSRTMTATNALNMCCMCASWGWKAEGTGRDVDKQRELPGHKILTFWHI